METKKLVNFKSITNLKNEVEKTYTLISAINAQILTTQHFLRSTKAESRPDYQKFKTLLEIDDKQIERIYELGFIALFANFECFMFDFLKELFKEYPDSFKSEKMIKFEDIKDFDNINDVKDYFIDSIAIEKSYDIDTWADYLGEKFGIKIYKDEKEKRFFKALNSLRNLIMHSGGKTSSKFRNEMKTFLKVPVPLGQKFSLSREKYFNILYQILNSMIKNIEK